MKNIFKADLFKGMVLAALISVVLLEIALRMFADFLPSPYEKTPLRTDESLFWEYSAELGWDFVPNSTGRFTNGFFNGLVSIDDRGIRKNSQQGTYVEGYANILFVGDSTTASFEVDDDETVPAVLEQLLREHGVKVNVLNLGARGYGTDQSIRKAIKYAKDIHPADIIYMYTDNDIYENNTLQKAGRKFGKGSYIRNQSDQNFSALEYPVPKRAASYTGMIVLDAACKPVLYEETVLQTTATKDVQKAENHEEKPHESAFSKLKLALRYYSYTARALFFIKHEIGNRLEKHENTYVDPYELFFARGKKLKDMSSVEISLIETAYEDDGILRNRCSEYFDAQIAFLLGKAKSTHKVRHVHVAQFPMPSTSRLLRSAVGSPNSRLFDRLVQQGVIDSHTNLAQIAIDHNVPLKNYSCKGDGHFCEDGNRWIAKEIYRTLISRKSVEN